VDQYAPHLNTSVVEEQIFPHLQAGFSDSNAYIRELTLKSILSLAPKLSNKTLTQSVLKHLSKLQVRGWCSGWCSSQVAQVPPRGWRAA
jgi:SCY1-like protein 1